MAALGYYQQGDMITFTLTALDGDGGSAAWPDAAPTITIKDSGLSTIDTLTMYAAHKPGDKAGTGEFECEFIFDGDYSVDSYTADYAYANGAYNHSSQDTIEIVAGGDPDSTVIGLGRLNRYSYEQILMHMASGKVLAKRNPT